LDVGVEISLYPLADDYIPPIADFIARLNRDSRLKVITNSMSTQVFGPYDVVLGELVREMKTTMQNEPKVVFVMKVLGPLAEA
jgi:uncharacterized protein YqgV (UPF0045/DUF77 family)